MERFLNLTVRGFRRLAAVDLELHPLTVLIGANGVGKSSVLDALSILASSAQGNLSAAVSENSGLAAMTTYDRTSEVGFGISMTVPSYEPLDYSLGLQPQGAAYLIDRETLQQRRQGYLHPFLHIDSHGSDIKYFEVDQGRLVRPNWEHNPLESSLSQVPKLFRAPEEFRRRLASSTFYHVLNVEPGSPGASAPSHAAGPTARQERRRPGFQPLLSSRGGAGSLRRDVLSGLLLALAIACKVTPALFLPYLVWKRSWRALVGSTVGLALFLWPGFVPALVVGWSNNQTHLKSWYDDMVYPFVVEGKVTSEMSNQSLPGVVYRLTTHSPADSVWNKAENRFVPTRYANLLTLNPATRRLVVKVCMGLFALLVLWCCRTPLERSGTSRSGAEMA